MDCTIILFVADWTLFCDFTRKYLPARLVIFVAQLGRKFRLFSLTVQRYEYFQCLPNNNRKMTQLHLSSCPENVAVAVLQLKITYLQT